MQTPILSIIVCTYNREKYIGECLTCLAKQNVDKSQYEVLIVNNLSTDNTQKIVDEIIQKYPEISFLSFIEEKQGHTFARNRGIREAKGSILSFIDDDAFVEKTFCSAIIEFFKNHENASAIGGKIIPLYENKRPAWMSKYLLPLVAALDLGNQIKAFKGHKFPIGANMAFRKSMFDKYGIFDVNLGRRGTGLEGGDEKELFLRLKRGGEKIWYVPQVSVQHIIPDSRIKKSYIKGLAIGVGTSERKRLSNVGAIGVLNKVFSEIFKSSATIILSILYSSKGQVPKAKMLILFRYWVLSGFFKQI